MADIKEEIGKINKKYAGGKSLSSYKLTYQSDINQLEPIYFWILDFMQNGGVKIEKIVDNYTSSPGSGQFAEMGQRATLMQQQATKMLGDTNTLIKSIVNLIYDLKEFEIRIGHYEKANSKDPKEKERGMLALKNIWLDQVDLKRGTGSIHQMANQLGYTTLRELFLAANSVDDLKKIANEGGLGNEMSMRVLIPRISEFLMWKDLSEREIRSRFAIEKSYLRSQVENLKLYTKWAKPYLKAAEELRMKGFDKDPALVSAFSTTRFEITLLGKGKKSSPDQQKFKEYKLKRDYIPVYVVSLNYRGELAQKLTQRGDYGFGYGGKVDITFDCYALNSEEIKLIEKNMRDSEIEDGLKLVESNTDVALATLKDDIVKYCGEDAQDKLKKEKEERKKAEEKKKSDEDLNPFVALFKLFTLDFSFGGKEEKKEIKEPKDIKPDNFVEKEVRKSTEDSAKGFIYAVYDVYKKAHGMASSPEKFEN